ncbi:hypothetical protein QZH41_008778, partial [Actinostola sp. cb2023]
SKPKGGESVKVVVRCRPMNEKEIAAGHVSSKQIDLYDETFRQLVGSVLEGYNGTIFAYGQTGTGKTFTMEGIKSDQELKGVIPNSFEHVFTHIARSTDQQYLVRASYLEIYQEEIKDLLAKDLKKRLELKERPDTGVYVKDLQSFVCKSIKEIEHVMSVGNQNRSVGSTNMNEHSSRSHAIFIVTIECSCGERLKEATKINLSLSALGNVISSLVDGKSTHIPYRDSKLTRLLQDSLGGNARTVMVANIGPASYNYEESITTLRYANRAKNIKNKPHINEDPKDALLREFQEEIARLKNELERRGGKKKKRRKGPDGRKLSTIRNESNFDFRNKFQQTSFPECNIKSLLYQEKQRLMGVVQQREKEMKKQREAQTALTAKIKMMESKLLVGGKSIIDKTTEQERALEQRRHEIAEQKRREREMQQKLESKDEDTLEVKETYTSLHQEVESKTKKLKKLFMKLQAIKSEITDQQEVHIRERQELEQAQEELTRELKLKATIVESFIPPEEKTKLMNRAYYDEENEVWKLKPLAENNNTSVTAAAPISVPLAPAPVPVPPAPVPLVPVPPAPVPPAPVPPGPVPPGPVPPGPVPPAPVPPAPVPPAPVPPAPPLTPPPHPLPPPTPPPSPPSPRSPPSPPPPPGFFSFSSSSPSSPFPAAAPPPTPDPLPPAPHPLAPPPDLPTPDPCTPDPPTPDPPTPDPPTPDPPTPPHSPPHSPPPHSPPPHSPPPHSPPHSPPPRSPPPRSPPPRSPPPRSPPTRSPLLGENIIMIELDMPNRTTRDYEGPAVAPRVQAALDAALQDEEDLTLDAEYVDIY